jgi:hypothetical protein
VIWEPFLLALVLGLIVSSGLYFAYLWPQGEQDDDGRDAAAHALPDPPIAVATTEPVADDSSSPAS